MNRLKDRNHMFTSTDTEEAINKIQYPVMIKVMGRLWMERSYLIQHKKSRAKIKLNFKHKTFLQSSGTPVCLPVFPVLESLATEIS